MSGVIKITVPLQMPINSAWRDSDHATVTTWVAVLAAMIGTFMAILNIQITNASLLNTRIVAAAGASS
jgi:DHA2 family multidrug resistance protein